MTSLIILIISAIIVSAFRKHAFRGTNTWATIIDIGLVILVASLFESC